MDADTQILQFRVTLEDVEPQVWRQIQVPDAYNFWDLHVAIQDAMGWQDKHLHRFEVTNPTTGAVDAIGIPDDEPVANEESLLAGWEATVVTYFRKPGDSATYEYDFGDSWLHQVVLEGTLPWGPEFDGPRCVAGAQACPPEDSGGPHAYAELLEAVGEPSHERHGEMVEWLEEGFDPNAFDPSSVVFDDPLERWEIAFGED